MIGKFIDTIIPEDQLPKTLTSYSPCFRRKREHTAWKKEAYTEFISLKSRK